MPKHKYVVKNHVLYVKVDELYYMEYPGHRLIRKDDLIGFSEDTDDLRWAVYTITCSSCPNAKHCHEEAYEECEDDEDTEYSKMIAFGESEEI